MIYVIDYAGPELKIVGHPTEGGAEAALTKSAEAGEVPPLVVRSEADLEGVEKTLLLDIINFSAKKKLDELPPEPARVAWAGLEGKKPAEEPVPEAPKNEPAPQKKRSTKAATANTSDGEGAPLSEATTEKDTTMATTKGKGAAKKAGGKKKAAAKRGVAGAKPRGEKTLKVKALLERKSGCTRDDILKATGWTAVSVPAMAEACGLKLRQEKPKEGGPTRYWGS